MSHTTAPARPANALAVRLDAIQTAEAVFAVDDGQRIVTWSPAAEQLFGRTAEEAMGRLCFEVLGSPEDHADCRPGCRLILEARRGRAIAHPDIHARHVDGHPITLRASSFVMPGGTAAPAPGSGAINDAGSGVGADATDGPERAARPVVVHLVRAKAGTARRTGRHSEAHHASTAAAHEAVPALISPLTPRELEVLHLLAVGRSTLQIAEELTIRRLTARNHVLSIEQKLGAHSRVAVVFLARHHGLI